jgi:hypothetical protein
LCGTIAGADTWEEIVQFAQDRYDWLAGMVDLSEGIPSQGPRIQFFPA